MLGRLGSSTWQLKLVCVLHLKQQWNNNWIIFCYLCPFMWDILFPISQCNILRRGCYFPCFSYLSLHPYPLASPEISVPPVTVCFSLMIVKIVWDTSNKRKQSAEEQTTALCLGTSSPFIKPSRTALRLEPEVVAGTSGACFVWDTWNRLYLHQTTCGG